MKIYILLNDRIVPFQLPKNVEGSFLLDYTINNKKNELVTIEAIDNQWVAYSNDDIKLFSNNSIVDKMILQSNMFYQLLVYGNEIIYIYTFDSFNDKFLVKMVPDNSTLSIGSNNQSDIVFSLCRDKQVELKFQNGRFYYSNVDVTIPIYVNLIKKNECFLNNFDVIFILGIKIIVVGHFLFIFDPNSSILYYSNKFLNPVYEKIISDFDVKGRTYKDFYSDDDYFARSPIFQYKLEKSVFEIAQPPSTQRNKSGSVFMQVIPSVAMSLSSLLSFYFVIRKYNSGETDKESFITSLVMCVLMLFTGVFWPFIQNGYEKIIDTITISKNRRLYKKYLKKKKESINAVRTKTQIGLKDLYIDLEECVKAINQRTPYLFSNTIDSDRFLSIKLGLGTVLFDAKFNYSKPEFSLVQNKLYDEIDKMVDEVKYLNDVPITVSLRDNNILAFLNRETVYKYDYMKYILLQLVTLHSFSELKIVMLVDEIGESEFSYFKNVNHCWDDSMSIHFFSSNIDDGRDISTYLESIFMSRINDKNVENMNSPHYLIVCDSIKMYRELNIIKDVLETNKKCGFSLVIFDDKLSNIPGKCIHFVNYGVDEGTCFETVMEDNNVKKFVPDFETKNSLVDYSKAFLTLSNIPMKIENNSSKDLPTKLGFLEMFGVGKVELLNAENRWKNSDIVNTLATPVGVDTNGNIVNLDLHEKRHGPHGLIAGMTGSGKSEFIITYILSLAVNYSPEEVQFVLIDYKGGGLAGAFENRQKNIRLPHLAGTITNLDKSEMHRTLASIQSELQRRQLVFNQVKEQLDTGTIDIYKYQQLYRDGKITEPMSHLFIISDEFAELKAQQPDFMDELVSAARIGRSLGIHLILATQKPSGVVDDQIWSNSKFKVCCKVQTVADSQEMLGKPDAASLKDSGRFYLQVGYDIYYILGQSAYSGSKYVPSNKIVSNIDNSVNLLNNIGEVLDTVEVEDDVLDGVNDVDYGEELTNVLKYLISVAESKGLKAKRLWLDNIPDHIYLEDIKEKYKDKFVIEKGILNPIIGEYDNPEKQKQGVVTLPITLGGNCFIGGVSGSGKSTLLSTIILSTIITHTTNEVNFYIIDFGNEKLKRFEKAPQVGNVLTIDNSDKILVLLNRVISEIKYRKKVLSKSGLDYINYVKLNKTPYLPNYVLIINGFDSFKDQFEDFVDDKFLSIIRDCTKYGITVIISAISTMAVTGTQFDQFSQRIALKFTDSSDYTELFDTKLIPKDNPGRGLIKIEDQVYQFQTSLIVQEENLEKTLNQLFERLSTITTKVAGVPIMPDIITTDQFLDKISDLSMVPIGYNLDTIETSYFNFNNLINVIIASKYKYLNNFVQSVSLLISNIPKTKVILLDGNKRFKTSPTEKVKYYDSGFSKLLKFLYDNMKKFDSNSQNKVVIFISGYENIQAHLKEYYEKNNIEDGVTLENLISFSDGKSLYRFVICGTYTNSDKFENESWYNVLPKKTGIVLFTSFDDQELINSKKLDNEYSLNLDETNAFVVRNNSKEIISYISD